tara:strand:+ start:2963 stop:3193 length:231 start_codon:yes stop_codon:yes gene_type:complete
MSEEDREEVKYLNVRNSIRNFLEEVDYDHIIRYMIDDLDTIEDINNTQSMELFKLISNLEIALQSYKRLKNDLQTV